VRALGASQSDDAEKRRRTRAPEPLPPEAADLRFGLLERIEPPCWDGLRKESKPDDLCYVERRLPTVKQGGHHGKVRLTGIERRRYSDDPDSCPARRLARGFAFEPGSPTGASARSDTSR